MCGEAVKADFLMAAINQVVADVFGAVIMGIIV
jgi:hypothetical protein